MAAKIKPNSNSKYNAIFIVFVYSSLSLNSIHYLLLSFPIFGYPSLSFPIFPYIFTIFCYLSLSFPIFHYPSLSFHYLSLSFRFILVHFGSFGSFRSNRSFWFILANWTHAIFGSFGSNGSFLLTGLKPFLVHLVQMVHFC